MRTKNVTSVALLFMLMLLGQAMTGHLHQYPGMDRDSSLESESVVMASNSTDSDGDGVNDVNDSCPNGDTGWTSSYSTDHDTDGCQDTSEDTDDDNDGLLDVNDYCMVGDLGWISSSSTDYDSDGCKDSTEDMDDDNDGVVDSDDSCPTGELSWTSTSSTDADGDGCRDSTEDVDGGDGSNSPPSNSTSNECLTFTNLSFDYNYSAAPQDSFNVTADLTNTCADAVMYPNTVVVSDMQGLNISSSSHWRYMVGGDNSSYPVSWQISRDSTFGEGEMVVFEIHPSRDNCYENCTESQNYNYSVEIPFGLIDLNSCYTLGNITDDYTPYANLFNLSVDLTSNCPGPSNVMNGGLFNYPGAMLNGNFINETSAQSYWDFYGIGQNDSTSIQWQLSVPSNLTNGTQMTYTMVPTCAVFQMSLLWPSPYGYGAYSQLCSDVDFDEVNHSVVVINSNLTQDNVLDPDNNTDNNTDQGNNTDNNTDQGNNTGNNTNNNTGNNTDQGNNTGNNTDNNTNQGNNTGNNTDNNTDQGNNTENNTQNTDDLLVIGDCTFSEMNFDNAAHVIFYLSWTDTSDVDHCGTIQFELYSNEAPIHVQNFQDHVGAGNYDGVIFHRIINDFMTQSGDIQYGNGMGGYAYSWQGYCNGQQIEQANCQLNDYSIPDEFDTSLVHNKGALSMAHAGANTGGSQFFIMDRDDATWLDGVHSVFGQAIAGTIDGVEVTGIEVVDAISQVGVEGPSGSTPIHDVTILSAENIGTPQTIENPSLPDDDNGEDESIPSIGIIGTAVAISAGFFIAIRREDEE